MTEARLSVSLTDGVRAAVFAAAREAVAEEVLAAVKAALLWAAAHSDALDGQRARLAGAGLAAGGPCPLCGAGGACVTLCPLGRARTALQRLAEIEPPDEPPQRQVGQFTALGPSPTGYRLVVKARGTDGHDYLSGTLLKPWEVREAEVVQAHLERLGEELRQRMVGLRVLDDAAPGFSAKIAEAAP